MAIGGVCRWLLVVFGVDLEKKIIKKIPARLGWLFFLSVTSHLILGNSLF